MKKWKVAEIRVSYKPTHDKSIKVVKSLDAYFVLRNMWNGDLINLQEQFCVLFLNQANEIVGFRCLHTGTQTETAVDLTLLFSIACKLIAKAIIIAHNHPSGNREVSDSDKLLTQNILKAAKLLDIALLDHIILTGKSYVSLADLGLIKAKI